MFNGFNRFCLSWIYIEGKGYWRIQGATALEELRGHITHSPDGSMDIHSETNDPSPQGEPSVAGAPVERYAVRMVNIEKYFGLVCALKNINLEVGHNEIIGLIGDNGAGKSTMVKILTGVFPPTSGELYIAGQKVDLRTYNVKRAHAHGVETVYQDRSLGEKQVLWRNFFVGRQITLCWPSIVIRSEK